MRQPKFPSLTQLIAAFGPLQFKTDLIGAAKEHYQNLLCGRKVPRHVIEFPGNRLGVRVYVRSKYIVFGYGDKQYALEKMARLADMVVVFFSKYQIRERGLELNTNLAQAKDDLETHKEMAALLKNFEDELIKLGVLPTPEQFSKEQQAGELPRVTSSLREQSARVEEKLNVIYKIITGLELTVNNLAAQINRLNNEH